MEPSVPNEQPEFKDTESASPESASSESASPESATPEPAKENKLKSRKVKVFKPNSISVLSLQEIESTDNDAQAEDADKPSPLSSAKEPASPAEEKKDVQQPLLPTLEPVAASTPNAGPRGAHSETAVENDSSRSAWMAELFAKNNLILGGIALAVGGLLGAGVAIGWFATHNPLQPELTRARTAQTQLQAAEKKVRTLESQVQEGRDALTNMRTGYERITNLFTDLKTPPEKPHYQILSEGVLVYWMDDMLWRKYYLYQRKGSRGVFKRVNTRPTRKNFFLLDDISEGLWFFGVTALDREGVETERSELLEVRVK